MKEISAPRPRYLSVLLGLGAFVLLGFLIFNLIHGARFDSRFEGIVRYRLLGSRVEAGRDLELFIKGDKYRLINTGSSLVTIGDRTTHKTFVMKPEREGYAVWGLGWTSREPHKAKWEKSGRTDIVAGHKTEEWVRSIARRKDALWVCEGLGVWDWRHTILGPSETPAEFKNGDLFPLRMGNQELYVEVMTVERKRLASSLFEIPSGYTAMSYGALVETEPGNPFW